MTEHQYQQFRRAGIIEKVCVRIASTFASNGNSACHVSLQDIRDVFPDAQRFKLEELPIPFLIDPNGNRVEPPCIGFYPYKILDVITEAPQLSSSDSSSSSTGASNANTSNTSINTNTSTNTNIDNTNCSCNNNSNHSALIHLPTLRKSSKQASQDTLLPLSNLIHSFNSFLTTRNNAYIEVINSNLEKVADVLLEAKEKDDKMLNLVLETKEKDSEMFELQDKMAKMQVEAKEKDDIIQHQSLDKPALLQQHVDAILTQNTELHEYVIPRLFIILPVDHTKWDPMNVLKNKIRVHFLCECGDHTAMTSKNSQKPLHIIKHDGYEIRSSTEFFRKYGKHMFILLKWLKLGMTSSTSLAPSPDLMDAGIDCSIDYMEALSKKDPGLSNIATIDGYDGLKGSDFQNVWTSLRTNDEDRQFGNLYRIMSETGRAKWVCLDHCCSMYEDKEQKAFVSAVEVNSGKYNGHLGKVTITLRSRERAKGLFDALSRSIRVYELDITFGWDWTETDLEAFENALAVSSVKILRLGLTRTQRNAGIKDSSISAQYEKHIRIIELSNMKTIHITLSQDLMKLLSLRPAKLAHLHKLTFGVKARSIGASELQGLVNLLKTNTALTTLDLTDNPIFDKEVLTLSEALKTNTTLAILDLSDNSVGDKGALALSEALKINSSLTSLRLGSNSIGDEGALALSVALKANTALSNLDLWSNLIGNDGALALSEALKVNTSLITLGLWENSIGDEGALALSGALKVNTDLMVLDLWRNSIGDEGARVLSEALKVNNSLRTLDLSNNLIWDEGSLALSEALKANSGLNTLDLSANSIEGEGALALSEALKVNRSLMTLDLSENSIRDEGALALSEALKVTSSLMSLDLSENSIRDEGALALSEALKVTSSLMSLDLSYNSIEDEGALALSEALKVTSSLMTLDLSYNSIGKKGTLALSEALKVNTTLMTLNLGGNAVGDEAALAISEALKTNAVLAKKKIRQP
ncbi:hypothetical protein BCR41DRAFT_345458 [Lobosporangium transversale]|uniref:RNI-like protein n=1 Tax=Lobosporangium transversale TaxID=64571 RepID=A0A1Y2H3F0_9FUNG|nr:hypothetical protein BCR41DRAFT_345458 [Lobosporangium transversale]ORZ28521.1 hypothetical protein BCR41DRAFT_345458 [Lobosporangium transversale]|eukprot:XP_021886206.1 hypothetical protein BCR41DRAFT_345458 [Lobosporangium transversale]